MLTQFRPALALTLFFTVITGLAYPLLVTGVAQALFPAAANGSLVTNGETVIGSSLIAQPFASGAYLHPRASASGWNAAGTGATNLGPTSAALIAQVADRRAAWEALNGTTAPIDAVTTSGSGLDPHISVETALAQADRIADARGVDAAVVRSLIETRLEGRFLGLYGEPRVNVLLANIALDEAFPLTPAGREGAATE